MDDSISEKTIPKLDLESLRATDGPYDSPVNETLCALDNLAQMPKSELLEKLLFGQEDGRLPVIRFDDSKQYVVGPNCVESEGGSLEEKLTFSKSDIGNSNDAPPNDVLDGRNDEANSDDEVPDSWSALRNKKQHQHTNKKECKTKIIPKSVKKEKGKKSQDQTKRRSSLRENFYQKYTVDNCSDYVLSEDGDDDVDSFVYRETTDDKNINVSDLVGAKTAMFDNRKLFLHPVCRETLTSLPVHLCQEFFSCVDYCEDYLRKILFIHVLGSESEVRHYPDVSVNKLEWSITHPDVSFELGVVLRNWGDVIFTLLQSENIIGPQLTLDVKQKVAVEFKGKKKLLNLYTDLLGCNPRGIQNDLHSNNSTTAVCSEIYVSCDNRVDKEELASISECLSSEKVSEEKKLETVSSKVTKDKKVKDFLGLVLVLCPRDSIVATAVMGQYLYSMTHRDLLTYILALRVGPMVSKQEAILYQYRPRTRGQTLPESSLDKVMALWDRYEGRIVFPVTSVENLARLSIYDYPGLSKERARRKNQIHLYMEDNV